LVEELWQNRRGVLSVQVLQELYVSLTRKLAQPLAPALAREIVSDLTTWQVVAPGAGDVVEAIDASVRLQVAFWDAMLLTTARQAGARVLWSEDLSDGQAYDGVVVRNPFR
jgi:predicted nucleic acid-binding protein